MPDAGPAEPLARARARWAEFSWTRALLAVTTAERAATRGPLAGLTFTVKDTFATAGLASTAGSLLLAGHVPERDAVVVARLRAGAAPGLPGALPRRVQWRGRRRGRRRHRRLRDRRRLRRLGPLARAVHRC